MDTIARNSASTLRLAFAAFLFFALPLAPCARAAGEDGEAAAGAADVLQLQGGKKRAGEIQEESATKVKIKVSDQMQIVKREEILKIDYRDRPAQFAEAERALARGDAESAAKALRSVIEACEAGKVRPIFKPHAYLRLGRALVAAQKFDEAGQAFAAGAEAAPGGWFVQDLVREGVRAFIRAGNATKARQLAEKAGGREGWFKKNAELSDDDVDEASLLRAEALEADGKLEDARTAYNLLTTSRNPRVRGRAQLGAARGALQAKDIERAESKFREILADKDAERSARCGAARGLGDAILARPGAEKDLEKLRQAAAAYANALAVYSPGRDEPTSDREAALARAADVYDALAALCQGEKESKGREFYQSMARQLREELVRLYRNSPFRAEVERKLGATEASKQ